MPQPLPIQITLELFHFSQQLMEAPEEAGFGVIFIIFYTKGFLRRRQYQNRPILVFSGKSFQFDM